MSLYLILFESGGVVTILERFFFLSRFADIGGDFVSFESQTDVFDSILLASHLKVFIYRTQRIQDTIITDHRVDLVS